MSFHVHFMCFLWSPFVSLFPLFPDAGFTWTRNSSGLSLDLSVPLSVWVNTWLQRSWPKQKHQTCWVQDRTRDTQFLNYVVWFFHLLPIQTHVQGGRGCVQFTADMTFCLMAFPFFFSIVALQCFVNFYCQQNGHWRLSCLSSNPALPLHLGPSPP